MQVTYGTDTFDFNTLPESSKLAMLKRGVTHFFGNEISSKVTGWTKKLVSEGTTPTDDEIAAKRAEWVAEAKEKLEAGTVGTSTRGPSQDPVEAEMERIARREINGILKTNNVKFTGKGDDRRASFADGSAFTMEEMVERRLGNEVEGARIRGLAESAIADAAQKARESKSATPVMDPSQLGL